MQQSFREIANTLCDEIRCGVIEVGSLLPTERELQARFDSTRSAVRRALAEIVESGWGEAVPNKGVVASTGPVRRKTQNIAFIDHRIGFNQRLFVSLSVKLEQAGHHLVLVDSMDRGVERAVEYAHEQEFAAAFVWSKVGYPDADRLRRVLATMPVIALDHSLRTIPTDLIADDNYGGAYSIIRHLTSLGRRNIAITGMFDMQEVNHDRFGGYMVGLFSAGIQPLPRNFLFSTTSALKGCDFLNLERRLLDEDRPDALFVLQDENVSGVAEIVQRCGLRIPEDVAIVAFRGDVIPQFGDVALTTVEVDWDKYAQQCVDRLLQRIERPMLPPETFRLPTRLVVRGSCGAPRDQWAPTVGPANEPAFDRVFVNR